MLWSLLNTGLCARGAHSVWRWPCAHILYYAHSVPLAAQAPHRRVLDDPGPPGEAGAKNAVAQPMSGAERRTEAPRAACGGWAEAASQRPFLSRSFCAYSSMSYDSLAVEELFGFFRFEGNLWVGFAVTSNDLGLLSRAGKKWAF